MQWEDSIMGRGLQDNWYGKIYLKKWIGDFDQ